MEHVAHFVVQYGYPAIFLLLALGILGVPVPDELLLMTVGYLIFEGRLNGPMAVAVAVGGTMCGITLSYLLGRGPGVYVIRRWGYLVRITPRRMLRAHQWFDRFGKWLLTFGYFLPGFRHLTALVAGISRLRPATFALFGYAGAVVWSTTFLTLGYFLGDRWSHASARVHHVLLLIAASLVVAWLLYLAIRRWNGRGRIHT